MAKRSRSRARRAAAKPTPTPALKATLVNPHAARHGDYRVEAISIVQGELEDGEQGQVLVLRNRGGTTVERWLSSGSLNRGQAEAIALYAMCWRTHLGEQRTTMNWSLTATIRGLPASEFAEHVLDAKETLADLDRFVFRSLPSAYVDVWKNVVLFDEAAGVAGARLGYRSKQAEASAKTIVLMLAEMVAAHLGLGELT